MLRHRIPPAAVVLLLVRVGSVHAQEASEPSPQDLDPLSLEELLELRVETVARVEWRP